MRASRDIVGLLLAAAAGAVVASASAQDTLSFEGTGDAVAPVTIAPPEIYTVQPGDTLWEISSKFLGNPAYWPQLWSINEYITNPHWIYPGNRIVFRMGTLLEPPSIELETPTGTPGGYVVEAVDYTTVDAECGPDVRFDETREARTYIADGFLADKHDVEIYGRLVKARTGMLNLSERDLVYVELDDPDAFSCGDVVSVFRRLKKTVRNPRGKGNFGSLFRVVAEGKIVHIYDDVAAVVLRQTWTEAERGDLVGPVVPVSVEVEVGPPKGDLEGVIVERVSHERFAMTTGETVFIDRGRADGIRVGNSFYITEQRDEVIDRRKEDPHLPPSVIGRLVVVRVDEYTSTAVITDASRNLAVGSTVGTTVD